jgi:hypothetical protein
MSRFQKTISALLRKPQQQTRIPASAVRELEHKVAAIPFWFHSLDLATGVVTPGLKSPQQHMHELASFRIPDLRGKTVLDIGAWDGFYSFAAERLGAAVFSSCKQDHLDHL